MSFQEMLEGFALHEIICDDEGHPVDYRFLSVYPAFEQLTGLKRILLVDDEESVVRLERMVLERLGYQVTTLTGSVEALNAFKANPDGFDLVITDMAMPELTGDQLALKLMSIRPNIPVILCTGFTERINAQAGEGSGIKRFLKKPMSISEIARVVREVLDGNDILWADRITATDSSCASKQSRRPDSS